MATAAPKKKPSSKKSSKLSYAREARRYVPHWSLQDKQRFVTGLSLGPPLRATNGSVNWQELSRFIGNKSVYQVKDYARKLNNVENGGRYPEFNDRVVIDIWRDLAAASASDKTAEFCFPQVLTVAALEPKPTSGPDYKKIYNYLSAVTRGTEAEELGPLEAAVVVDLIDDLIDTLSSSEALLQRELLHERYGQMRQLLIREGDDDPNKQPVDRSIEAQKVLNSKVRQTFPSMNPFAIPFELLELKSRDPNSINMPTPTQPP